MNELLDRQLYEQIDRQIDSYMNRQLDRQLYNYIYKEINIYVPNTEQNSKLDL